MTEYTMDGFEVTLIKTDTALENACNLLLKEELLSVDSETTGLNPRRDKLRLVQIACYPSKKTFLIDYFKITKPEPLTNLLMSWQPKLNYNGKFDSQFYMHNLNCYIESPVDLFLGALLLQRYGLPIGVEPDTKEARSAKLIPYLKDKLVERRRGGGNGTLKLNSVLKLFTGIDISKELQLSDWSGELTDAQLDYAAKDVQCLFPLFDKMIDEINAEGLDDAFLTENGCQLATAMMEYYGIKIDVNELESLGNEVMTKIKKAEELIGKYPEFQATQQSILDMMSGKTTTIDIGSHVQTGEALEKRWGKQWWKEVGLEKASTQAADLKKMYERDPELVMLLAQRASLVSIHSNHVEGMFNTDGKKAESYIDPVTHRVHSNYMQNASGQQRMLSEKPILLNIPNVVKYGPGVNDKESTMYSTRSFRDVFIPAEGCVFVRCDYSALQLKALAQESEDPVLVNSFKSGKDVHVITAVTITGKDESQINKSLRYTGKTTNYAVGFVCGAKRLQNTFAEDDVYFTEKECRTFIDKFMVKYKGVLDYHKAQRAKARREQRVVINGGRATLFRGDVGERPTDSVNFPMALYEQSGGKLAGARIARVMWKLMNALKEQKVIARIVLMVHDEIMLEVEERYAIAVAEVLEREMVQCMQQYIYKVPIEAETTICRTWAGKQIMSVGMPLPFEVQSLDHE